MRWSNKVKAYTTLELLIAMALSAIVIGAAVFALTSGIQIVSENNDRNQKVRNTLLLYNILKKDFYHARDVVWEGNKLIIKDSFDKTIVYTADSLQVERKANNALIFDNKIENVVISHEREKAFKSCLITISEGKKKYDFTFVIRKTNFEMFHSDMSDEHKD